MNKIFNYLFLVLKILLLVATLGIMIFIILSMYENLEKELSGINLLEFIKILIPFLLVIIVTVINIAGKMTKVIDNAFYNAGSFLGMVTILVFELRAKLDSNLVLWNTSRYHINFNYFADQIVPIKIILYIIFFANILLIIESKLSCKKELVLGD